MLEAFSSLCEDFQKSLQISKQVEVDQTSSSASKQNPSPSKYLDTLKMSAVESLDVGYVPELPPHLDYYDSRVDGASGHPLSSVEEPSRLASTKPKKFSHSQYFDVVPSSVSDHYSDPSDDLQHVLSRPKKHSDKSKHKSRSRFLPSSSREDQSPEHIHRSPKPSRKSYPDQEHPQHDPDPPYYREVAQSDIPSQYAEEVDTFRRILRLPDPRESLPRSSIAVMGLDDKKGRQELRPMGPSSMLPLNSIIKDAFDKFDQDFQAANLPEGKYIKALPSTAKWYKVGQPCVATRKEAPTGNAPMGAIPPKAVTNRFPQTEEKKTSEPPGVIFDPTIGEGVVETPLPNDSSKASISPPVGGRLRSFRRDCQANNCSSNVLNIITNGYVLPFLSKSNLVRFPLIISEYKALQKDQALADCIQSLLSKNAIERVENVKSLGFYSRLFLVPKPHQRWRPVIDLSRLNNFLHVSTLFKMETPESIRTSLIPWE